VKTTRRTKQCYLTELDVARLEKHAAAPGANARFQEMLDDVLERAVIVDSREIPANVVTMNSQATLVDESSGEQMTWTVVYPPDADFGSWPPECFFAGGPRAARREARRAHSLHAAERR